MSTPIEEVFRHLRETKEPDSWGLAYCVDSLFELEQSLLEREKDLLDQHYNQGWDNALYEMEIWTAKTGGNNENTHRTANFKTRSIKR